MRLRAPCSAALPCPLNRTLAMPMPSRPTVGHSPSGPLVLAPPLGPPPGPVSSACATPAHLRHPLSYQVFGMRHPPSTSRAAQDAWEASQACADLASDTPCTGTCLCGGAAWQRDGG